MMITSTKNGHNVIWNEEKQAWHYENGESADVPRNCAKCDKPPTKEGHDYCIRNLPGIKNACCGHGKEGYLMFENNVIVSGIFEIIYKDEVEHEINRIKSAMDAFIKKD